MARFYETAAPTFTDFVFQPNLDLKLGLAEQQVATDYLQQKMLNDVPDINIDHIAYDNDLVNKKRDYYNNAINEATQNIIKDPVNRNKHMAQVKNLKREMNTDFSTGEIANIQKNAQVYREFENTLKTLPNAMDREAYTKKFNEYMQNNKEARDKGEFGQVFNYGELYETKPYWNAFIASKSFTEIGKDVNGKITQNTNGKWLITKDNKTTELKAEDIMSAYKSYIESSPDVMGRAKAGSQYFGEDNWLDENGQLDFSENGKLGKELINGLNSYTYKEDLSKKTMDIDQYGLLDAQETKAIRAESRQRKLAEAIELANMPQGTKKINENIIKTAQSVIDYEKDMIAKFSAEVGLKPRDNVKTFSDAAKAVEKHIPKDAAGKVIYTNNPIKDKLIRDRVNLVQHFKDEQNKLKSAIYATYEPLKLYGYTDAEIITYRNNTNNFVEDKGQTVLGNIDITTLPPSLQSLIKNNTNMTKVSINKINEILGNRGFVKIRPNSGVPHILSENDNHNQLQISIDIVYNENEVKNTSSDNKLVVETSESEGKTYTTDFYIPMREIAGDSKNIK
jgi:hypothetical protein